MTPHGRILCEKKFTQTIQAEWEAFLETQSEAVREGYKGLGQTIQTLLEDAKAMVSK